MSRLDQLKAAVEELKAAVEERTGALSAWKWLAGEKVRGGARWAYVGGSLLAGLLLAQAATGIVLALDYAPTTDSAWESTKRIMDGGVWGPLIRGLHHHGATFLVLALVLHVSQVVLFGAYKKPREASWWTGLVLGLLILGFAFTGYLLPWDQTAYWACTVGADMLGLIPGLGPALKQAFLDHLPHLSVVDGLGSSETGGQGIVRALRVLTSRIRQVWVATFRASATAGGGPTRYPTRFPAIP